MKVAIWGFYGQGNIGDDLMGVMFAELVQSMGYDPVVVSRNPRFRALGYAVAEDLGALDCDAILLGGGAFIKPAPSQPSKLEDAVTDLVRYVDRTNVPVLAASIGSDDVSSLDQLGAARRTVLTHPCFLGAIVRLSRDLKLGIPNAQFLPDIVLATRTHFELHGGAAAPVSSNAGLNLLNLTRRAVPQVPEVLWLSRGRRRAIFLAHSGNHGTGGELVLPGIGRITSDDLYCSVATLAACAEIFSSKLHPGIIAMSFGRPFSAVASRQKTTEFLREYAERGLIRTVRRSARTVRISPLVDIAWQAELLQSYRRSLSALLARAEALRGAA